MKSIEFLKIVPLRGPNMWTYRPVLEAWIDIGELEDCPSNTIPGFYERLSAWLPTLIEHRCSYDERGGFLRRVKEGTWPGHILEHVTLELQNLAGMPGGFGKAREMKQRGVYKVIVRAWHEEVTHAALHAGRDLVMAAIEDRPFDVAAVIEELTDLADSKCLGPSTASIVDAADSRDIPAIRLSAGNLVQLGYGAKSRRIWTAETDLTGAIAESISRDKDLTKSLLEPCGVPVPAGRMVDSPADAWEAAQEIGLPVVVKPYDGNHGRGVFINLTTREEVETAYAVADDEGSGVMVERSISGVEHRLLVVGGKLAAATKGDMVSVIGDGTSTLQRLIDTQINSDPRRGTTEEHPLNYIRLDSAARMEISRQGLTSGDDVPAAEQKVIIQRAGNHAFDVTDEVHPEVAKAACLAARIVGLDIAGIDLVAEDISRPLEEQGGAIVEVNAGPSLLMHLKPRRRQTPPGRQGDYRPPVSRHRQLLHSHRRRDRQPRHDAGRADRGPTGATDRQTHRTGLFRRAIPRPARG
jgi:cyanophycin synthetase